LPTLGCVSELEGFGTKAYIHILGSELQWAVNLSKEESHTLETD
jgi:hypothetical protein